VKIVENIRVRFAPSPTGALHIGGARTALLNWLVARGQNGRLVLRLEDTDILRSRDDSATGILEGLKWLGLDWDEGPDIGGDYGPYMQSERLSIYQQYLQQLLDEGKAYYCFCTTDLLQQQREKAQQEKRNYLYPGTCRAIGPEDRVIRLAQGIKPVIRLKVPTEGTTVVHDLIRGDVSFDNSLLDDFVIAKSDGWPTYNFAVAVDDYRMKISHVVRAEEHLPNTPKQLLVFQALGLKPPQYAHVSMILAPDRSKLSKRHGATSVQEFRDEGYLPEALFNYLAILGWSPGENADICSREEILNRFALQDLSRSAAIYDTGKLTWMNGHYLACADIDRITELAEAQARRQEWFSPVDRGYFKQVIDLVRSRAKTVNELPELARYFFVTPDSYDEKGTKKYFRQAGSVQKLQAILEVFTNTSDFIASHLEEATRLKAEALGLKAGDLIHPARLAISGRTMTPGLFEVMELLGLNTCRDRINRAIDYIQALY